MAILSSSTSTTFDSKPFITILSLIINVLIFTLQTQIVYCHSQSISTNQNEQAFYHYTHLQDQPIHYSPSDSIDNHHQVDSGRSLLFDRHQQHHQQLHNQNPTSDYLSPSYTNQHTEHLIASSNFAYQHDDASLRRTDPSYHSGQQVDKLPSPGSTDANHYNNDDVRLYQYNNNHHHHPQQQQQAQNNYLNSESSQHVEAYPSHSETKQHAFVEPHNAQQQHQHNYNDQYHQQTDYYQSSQAPLMRNSDYHESHHRDYQQIVPKGDYPEITPHSYHAGPAYNNDPEPNYSKPRDEHSNDRSRQAIPNSDMHSGSNNNQDYAYNRGHSDHETKPQQAQAQLPDCQRIAAAAASYAEANPNGATNQDHQYESIHNKQVLLVATLNGLIYAIDLKLDGRIIWTKKVGNLFSSTVGSFGYNSPNGGEVKLIPSLDGKLYFHKTASNTLEMLPLDADSLLKNSHRLGDDFFLSGGKKHHIYGMDPITGSSIYDCGLNGCEYPKVEKIFLEHILVLEHTNRIVRAIHPKTGSEQWNIDVSQLKMRLVKNLEECQSLHKQPAEDGSLPNDAASARNYALPQIEWDIQKGYISSKNHRWFHQFTAPITSIWTLDDGFLAQLELFNFSPSKKGTLLYDINWPVHIGSHNNQLYVQTSSIHEQYAKLIQFSQDYYTMSDPVNDEHSLAIAHQEPYPQIEWYHKPGLTESEIVEFYEQGLPLLVTEKDLEPNNKPKESCEKPQLLKTSADTTCPQKNSAGYPSNSSPNSIDRHDIHINDDGTIAYHQNYDNSFLGMFNAVSYYWREFATVCLLTALFLNWLFVIVKRKLIKDPIRPRRQTLMKKNSSERRKRSESVSIVHQPDDQHREDYVTALTDKSASKSYMNENTPNLRHRTNRAFTLSDPCVNNSTWSTPPNSLSSSLNTSSMFKSRYSSDFDSIRRLGRGGFGVVFEAKNKIDDCHYAVKRICLPLEKDARERVMREVKALAKLDHSGIVRYYNAWLETPPEEWLKEHDKQFGISSNKDQFKTSLPSTYDTETDKIGLNINEFSASVKFRKDMGDTSSSDLKLGRRKVNSFKNRLLQNNSNSQSLDVVFEGSGSIRLEADSNDGSSDKHKHQSSTPSRPIPIMNNLTFREEDESDQSSDSDDMLQFSTKPRASNNKFDPEESSFSYDLSEPFSSSSEENSGKISLDNDKPMDNNGVVAKTPELDKNFINRNQLTNLLLTDNLHTEKAYLYIQMQLCRKDTLKNWLLTNCDKRDKTVIFDLFYQIVDAVEYVHSQDLIHRDLKPSNIFFSMDGIVKIGDFGLVTAKSTGIGSSLDLHENVAECDADRCIDAVHTEQVGTQLYMSPEQINGVNYNHKVDIFAMGLILIELLVPFRTQMQRINVLVKARNQFFSDEFRKNFPKEHLLLKSLLCRNPQKRPSAAELKQHELLTNCQLSAPVIERLYQRRRTISSNSSTE